MTREEMVLIISNKLQKQMHLINSEKQRNTPKMLCDNLADRVLSEIEKNGMLPPSAEFQMGDKTYTDNFWEKDE